MSPEDSDINHGAYERTACIVFCTITPIFVIARCWSRISSKQFGLDDWAAVVGSVFVLSCNIQTLVAHEYGWGRHAIHLTPRQREICLILHWTFQLTYKISIALNKTSVLLLYMRIMVQRAYRIASWSLLTIVALFAFATSIAGIFQCVPVDKAWKSKKPGHCYNLVDAWYSNAVFSIVTDVLILCLPLHMVWHLHMQKKEKMLLGAMFGLGGFITFTSIMRFFALKAARSHDTTYNIKSGFWSVIEINVGIICVSLPPLRAFISHHVVSLKHNYGSSKDVQSRTRPESCSQYQARERANLDDSSNELHYDPQDGKDGITKTREIIITDSKRSMRRGSDEIELRPFGHKLR